MRAFGNMMTLARFQGLGSVSYTHLDVYKRQALSLDIVADDEQQDLRKEGQTGKNGIWSK